MAAWAATRAPGRTRIDDRPGEHERRLHPACGVPDAAPAPAGAPARRRAGTRAGTPARVVHATGRSLASRVPGDPGEHRHARVLLRSRAGVRDHPAAGAPSSRRCCDPVLGHRSSAQGRGDRPRHRGRDRTGDRRPRAHRGGRGEAADPRARRGRCRRTGGRAAHPRARRRPAHRFRRGAVHPRLLPRRGRSQPQPRAHQGPHARRAAHVARPPGAARRHHDRVPAGPAARRRRRGPAVRLVGGRAVAGRLPRVRAAPLGTGVRRGRVRRRATHPLRRRHRRAARRDG